jgi:hypothetical protein
VTLTARGAVDGLPSAAALDAQYPLSRPGTPQRCIVHPFCGRLFVQTHCIILLALTSRLRACLSHGLMLS